MYNEQQVTCPSNRRSFSTSKNLSFYTGVHQTDRQRYRRSAPICQRQLDIKIISISLKASVCFSLKQEKKEDENVYLFTVSHLKNEKILELQTYLYGSVNELFN